MSDKKIKIAYDPSIKIFDDQSDKDKKQRKIHGPELGSWDSQSLRILIKELSSDEEIEMFIVTDNDDKDFIDSIVEYAKIDEKNVYYNLIHSDIVNELRNNNINIFLSDNFTLGKYVESEIPISLKPYNVTGSQFIEFNGILDTYKMQPKALTKITFWVDQIKKYLNGKSYEKEAN